MQSWNPNYTSTKAESCSGETVVRDDSGAHAVFTETGSSASQMTAAKVMDVIARLTGCDGQEADAVSAHTQVKLEDAARLFKIPDSECPDVGICWPKSWANIENPMVPLERNLNRHPLADCCAFIRTWMGENTELGMHVRSSKTMVISVRKCG